MGPREPVGRAWEVVKVETSEYWIGEAEIMEMRRAAVAAEILVKCILKASFRDSLNVEYCGNFSKRIDRSKEQGIEIWTLRRVSKSKGAL
jgi:hypothetical protein